ncbi:MAG: EAL domain-containing protein [Rhizobiaceae bacterium]|nr:EAL domain-containing protein [Rhizobiaceae bacterium]MCV0408389.1 EAL domain-containing protein [Rhizobiaceae bacterium]
MEPLPDLVPRSGTATGQPVVDQASQLARILAAAPIAIDLRGPEGEEIFRSNAETSSVCAQPRHFAIEMDGKPYSLSLTLDDLEQQQREQELIRQAYFDDLTGAPNRLLFERSVTALIQADPAEFAVALIDIDGFKQVNDYYGHAVGDHLLTRIAERLSTGLRPSDMLARLSGDEFVLLISPVSGREELNHDLAWIGERLKEPFLIDGYEICTSASIGVSTFPADGTTYEELRANADRAMYHGKTRAKGAVRFFKGSMRHAADERSRLEQRLRLAIRDKRVCPAYQPKVALRSGEVVGIEVLMRWRDEDGLIQPPGDFIGLAVELGLIDELTHSILAETVASIDLINDTFGTRSTISINVAARQAGDERFMRSFVDALSATGFATRFTVEITEEGLLSSTVFQNRIAPMLREVGAKISIDDFGVGFSSLSALAEITADELKIDRSFVTNIHARPRIQSVLKAIETLGHSLNMSLVVEGVERFEELVYLQTATCIDIGQGYYFAKPMVFEAQGDERPPLDFIRPSLPLRGEEVARRISIRK